MKVKMKIAVNKAFKHHLFREAGTEQEIDDVQDFVVAVLNYFGCKPTYCLVEEVIGNCFTVFCEFYDGVVKKKAYFDVDFTLTNDELCQCFYETYLHACME